MGRSCTIVQIHLYYRRISGMTKRTGLEYHLPIGQDGQNLRFGKPTLWVCRIEAQQAFDQSEAQYSSPVRFVIPEILRYAIVGKLSMHQKRTHHVPQVLVAIHVCTIGYSYQAFGPTFNSTPTTETPNASNPGNLEGNRVLSFTM
jgi:hypothetical protein